MSRQLKQLTKDVYVLLPATRAAASGESSKATTAMTSSSPGDGPESMIIFGWMDASLKHLSKYTERYERMYPDAHCLLVRSRQSHFYGSAASQRERLAVAFDWIKARHPHAVAGKDSPLLVHTFSNGGCFNLKALNELFVSGAEQRGQVKSRSKVSTPTAEREVLLEKGVPARCFIFDSCPGEGNLAVSIRAFTAPIRTRIVRWIASAIVAVVHMFFQVVNLILRKKPTLALLQKYVAERLPPVPRLYFYSREDKLIPYQSVERHLHQVKDAGVPTRVERFEGTSHVNHARGNEDRYYGAIRDLWNRSSK